MVLSAGNLAAETTKQRVETSGDILEFLLPSTVAGLSLLFRDYKGTGQFAAAFAATMALTWTLKLTINAKRPNGGPHSMPSGHTASAFSAASFAQKRYGFAIGVPLYLAAAYTGWSRIYTDNHFLRDVAVGAEIASIASGLIVSRLNGRVRLLPTVGRGRYGLMIEKRF